MSTPDSFRSSLRRLHLPIRFILCAVIATALTAGTAFAADSPRERVSLDNSWRFIKGDPADVGDKLAYAKIKPWIEASGADLTTKSHLKKERPAGNPGGLHPSYAKAGFDDSGWRLLDLPHDWGIEGPFKQEYPGGTGKLPWWGVAWYRKSIDVPASDKGHRIYLDVDGAMSYATVWVNGEFAGGWPYGYASWRVDMTPYLHFGAANQIAIRLDNPPNSSRWYPGGGIYRNVWLVKTAPVHVDHWGTYVTTPDVSTESATVAVQVRARNDGDSDAEISVKSTLLELDSNQHPGKSVASVTVNGLRIAAGKTDSAESRITIKNPKLWDLESHRMYLVRTTLEQDGKTIDQYDTPIGIRSIRFTGDNGFLLNGKRVQIKGVCDHHDLGALGAAINVRALQRQIEILQEMGCNAIRTSHNPPAPELLDLCDRMGMLVMDEAFDCWLKKKRDNDYHLLFRQWHEKDLRAMLHRDRNHPSIILWSIGNEIPDQKTTAGVRLGHKLAAIVRQEDLTRPVTSACNREEEGYNGFQDVVDVFGYNYRPQLYAPFHKTYPDKPLYGSETASCISSRGEYFFPVTENKDGGKANFQVSSYDLYAPPWATNPDDEFRGLDETPSAAGEFVWTGFDYLGEPTPYNNDSSTLLNFTDPAERAKMQEEITKIGKMHVPSRSSYFGIVDLAGFKKDRFYLYQARWRPELPMAHILPHWNWPDRIGQVTPVHVYTSGDEAELFLNGKSLGRKKKEPLQYRIRWDDVVYQPGELKVIAYKNGKKWATDTMKTTGRAEKLSLSADRKSIANDGKDLSYITVRVQDKDGLLVPRSDNHITFSVSGPGEIVATDNGDATSFESFQAPEHDAYNGMALVIIKAKAGKSGAITLTAKSSGLKPAAIRVEAK